MTTNVFENRILGYGTKAADQFLANPLNFRVHPERQRKAVQASLRELGWIGVVVENKTTGRLIDGHERVWQALQNNEQVPYIEVELSEEEEKLALAVFDPITYMAETDAAVLDALLRDVQTGEGALQELLAQMAMDAGLYQDGKRDVDAEPQVDRAEELRVQWGVNSGDLWQLGDHRLICGDCTDADVVARLMGGEKAHAVVTDPPYGIGVDKTMHEKGGQQYGKAAAPKRHYAESDWDNAPPSKEAIDGIVDLASQVIIWGGNYFDLPPARCYLVWDKQNDGNQFADCELAWTNLDKPVRLIRHMWNGMLREGKEERNSHPTQKPLAVMVWAIEQFSDDSLLILDTYVGSGTTIIACEQLGRKCRAVEISPGYVAVTLQRYLGATNQTPVRVE